jgi:2-keto-3-deoxy-L-rhamnonate aldolase RhmA
VKNTLKAALQNRQLTFGSWVMLGHPGIAEIMAQAGFDWLVVDMEHGAIGIDSLLPLLQAIELSGCVPLVRLPNQDPSLAKQVMDAGAHGVIVPMITTPQQAEQAVRSVRYPPAGRRGVGLGRAHGYGARFSEYLAELTEYSIVIVMIEHRDGVERVDEIARVPGVDGVFIGPYDLSASYEVPGQFDHPRVRDAMTRILAAAHGAGIAPGIHVVHPPVDQVRARIAEGFRFIAYGGDMLFLVPAVRSAVVQLRDLGG